MLVCEFVSVFVCDKEADLCLAGLRLHLHKPFSNLPFIVSVQSLRESDVSKTQAWNFLVCIICSSWWILDFFRPQTVDSWQNDPIYLAAHLHKPPPNKAGTLVWLLLYKTGIILSWKKSEDSDHVISPTKHLLEHQGLGSRSVTASLLHCLCRMVAIWQPIPLNPSKFTWRGLMMVKLKLV